MDPQLKRGFLEVCVLASISQRDSYGYQIVKDMPASLQITESTLYPLLKRLEAAGALTTYSVEHNGRMRKYYRITPVGTARTARQRNGSSGSPGSGRHTSTFQLRRMSPSISRNSSRSRRMRAARSSRSPSSALRR